MPSRLDGIDGLVKQEATMNKGRFALVSIMTALSVLAADDTFAGVTGFGGVGAGIGPGFGPLQGAFNDPPGRLFPGKYFEYKAGFYLKKKDYRDALRLYELAGYWANKIAQYNVGIMYYNGIGISQDKVRGVAWLGIAAENHDDLADRALQAAYASLTPGERADADAVWRQLNEDYGDAVTIPRALKKFGLEMAQTATGSHVGFLGADVTVYETGPNGGTPVAGSDYYRQQQGEAEKLISKITGHVSVGQVQPIAVSSEAKKNASQQALGDPSQTH
jgi:TPR repeat protein